MTTLYEIIVASAEAALALQGKDGAMPAGHNGPYHDPETPVRDTAHWLVTFLKAWELEGDRRFVGAAQKAVTYLLGEQARPMGATFWHRTNPEKDFCNGLVGQAWTIEALALAATALGDERCRQVGEAVFLLHPFDERLGVWRRVAVDGSYLSFDMTFNHQLWFAAAGSLLLPAAGAAVAGRVHRFLDALPQNMALYDSGLIRHPLILPAASVAPVSWKGRVARLFRSPGGRDPNEAKLYAKAIGYHTFNLYALAILRQQTPEHPVWRWSRLPEIIAYVDRKDFWAELDDNKYGYPYNPPGFEAPFARHVFADLAKGADTQQVEVWVDLQLRRCFNRESRLMELRTEDPVTHAARLYEATRLPDVPVHLASGEVQA